MEFFQHGTIAFGAYIGALFALLFLLPPSPLVINIMSGANAAQAVVIDFFGALVYRGDWGQDVIFLVILIGVLGGTSLLYPPNRHMTLAGAVFFLGGFFHLYLSFRYVPLFFSTTVLRSLPQIIVNAFALLTAAAGWSAIANRKFNPKTPPPQDEWVTIATTCPHCSATVKSNPQFCSECSTQLREEQ